jgi:hypothetical protein
MKGISSSSKNMFNVQQKTVELELVRNSQIDVEGNLHFTTYDRAS